MKITDELTLAVPLAFERTAHFDFFLPGFSGYTLENHQNDADPNKVEVAYLHAGDPHEADPDAPGEYPPNMLKRALQELLDARHYRDQYGLRCYPGRVFTNRITCFGPRTQAGEDIMLTALVPPYPADVAFPVFQARYFSRRYGGVRIEWRAHVANLPRWHEIDAQIWRFIDAWKVPDREPASNAAMSSEAPRRLTGWSAP